MTLKRVCVFCGSQSGADPGFAETATNLGRTIADEGCELVYGGGEIGLMGTIADAVSLAGGRVVAIIPQFLDDWEIGRRHSDEFVVTDGMHDRKAMMADRADAFIVLPGGLGTLDETFEIITWKQLRLHDKPIVVLNDGGYWSPLVALVDATVKAGFAAASHRRLFQVVDSVDEVFPVIRRAITSSGV